MVFPAATLMQSQITRHPPVESLRQAGIVKRRALRACAVCRQRKVRCDMAENGLPCTNCRLDDEVCKVAQNKRRLRNSENDRPLLPRSENTFSLQPGVISPNVNQLLSVMDLQGHEISPGNLNKGWPIHAPMC